MTHLIMNFIALGNIKSNASCKQFIQDIFSELTSLFYYNWRQGDSECMKSVPLEVHTAV